MNQGVTPYHMLLLFYMSSHMSIYGRGTGLSDTDPVQRSWVSEREAWTDHPGVPARTAP